MPQKQFEEKSNSFFSYKHFLLILRLVNKGFPSECANKEKTNTEIQEIEEWVYTLSNSRTFTPSEFQKLKRIIIYYQPNILPYISASFNKASQLTVCVIEPDYCEILIGFLNSYLGLIKSNSDS